jgi:cell shape-determining protein MreC
MNMKKFSSKMRGSSRQPSKIKWWTSALIGLLVVGFLLPSIMGAVGGVAVYPLHLVRVWWFESEASLPRYVRDKQMLIEEINTLERTLAQTESSKHHETLLQDENERLRSLLHRNEDKRIVARVLARPNQLPYDVLQIDRGSTQGVVTFAPVYVGQDQVIGFVSYVGRYYSYVTIFTKSTFYRKCII